MFRRLSVVLAAVLLLSGCASAAAPDLAPKPVATAETPKPAGGTRIGPIVQTHSAELQPVRVSSPPVRVQVDAVGVDVNVEPMGIRDDNLMDLPDNVAIAGWYEYGPDPYSSTGTTVIAAHVDSLEYGLGPFSKLKKLEPGAIITVTTVDGVTHDYRVDSLQSVAKSDLPTDQVFDRAGAPRLALITCGGQFDYNSLHYSDNVIVLATPVTP